MALKEKGSQSQHMDSNAADGDETDHAKQPSTQAQRKVAKIRRAPTFNLKAVVNETGLKPDTLRAWERRYGLPQPERTSGGHRLYSQRDIDMLKWLMQRQEEGLSISRAVDLWRKIEATGRDPLRDAEYGVPGIIQISAPIPGQIRGGNTIDTLRQQWLDACLAFDERKANAVLAQAFAHLPTETVCFDILQKGLSEVGDGWYEGRVSVQQEHFAAALAMRRLEMLVAATPPPTRNGRILAACPPEEHHTFGLLLLTLILRRKGWDVVYLGANVPVERLNSTLETAKPHLVILSAQTLYTAGTLLPVALLLQKERIPAAYGGAVFNVLPQLKNYMPGYFLGTKLEEVGTVVEQLLTAPPPMPMYQIASKKYQTALDHYRSHQTLIESNVWQQLEGEVEHNYLRNANKELGRNITAALTFGDMDLIHSNLEWVEGLLVNYHYRMPKRTLRTYLQAYYEAAENYLDERGAPIVEWLQTVVD